MSEQSKDLVVQSTAYSRASLEERQRYVGALAKAGDLLPPNYRAGMVRNPETNQMVAVGSAGKIMLMAETGDMLGIHPMAALVGVHIIEGKPSLSANLMNGLVRKAGHILRVKVTGRIEDETLEAHATLIRSDDPEYPFEVTWTLRDAVRAGLYPGKESSNWRKYPRAMLKSRVISEIIREGAADVLMGGNVYTPEELGAQVNEQGEPIELNVVRDSAPQPQQRPQAPIVDPDLPEPTVAQNAPERPAQTEPQADAQTGEVVEDEAAAEERERQERATTYAQHGGEEEAAVIEGEVEDDTDWVPLLEEAKDSETVRQLYRDAQSKGLLDMKITWGDADTTLGDAITATGAALVRLEAQNGTGE